MKRWLLRRFLAIGVWGALAAAGPVAAQSPGGTQNDLVAMLHSVDAAGQFDGSLCGSALVLSQSDGRTLLLTAKHVLAQLDEENDSRKLSGDPPVRLGAQFFGAVGTFHEVRPLPGVFNESLDYAVVEVIPRPGTTIAPPGSWNRLGALDGDDAQGDKPGYQDVRAVGYSRCRPWAASASPEKVIAVGGTDITFETRFVDHGSSGGALFAVDGRLVGMVVKTDGDEGTARSIDVILSDLALKNVRTDLTYGVSAAMDAAIRGQAVPTYASQVKATSVSARVERTGGKGVRFRADLDDLGAPAYELKLVGGPDDRDVKYGIDLDIADALTRSYQVRIEFSDGSSVTLPIDFKAPLTARIKALADSDVAWLYHRPGGAVVVGSPNYDVVGLVRYIDVGWSPDLMAHRAVFRYSGFEPPKLTGTAALNAVAENRVIVGPAGADRAWYRLTFADGSVTPPRALAFTPEEINLDRGQYGFARLFTTPEGVVFSYRYKQDDVGAFQTGGSIALSRPYGLTGDYTMQYDLDGKGFLEAGQDRLPWMNAPFKVRFVEKATGAVTQVFSLPAPDSEAVGDDAPSTFPEVTCRRSTAREGAACWFRDFRAIGHVKTWRMSFVSEARLQNAALADLRTIWRSAEGRARIRECRNSYSPACLEWRRNLGGWWDAPAGATDFYYSVTMKDGRTLPAQRVSLAQ